MGKTSIKEAIREFRTSHKDILTSLGQDTISRITQWIPSGCAVLDGALGGYNCREGSLPVGRIIEFFAAESKGKSTIAEHYEGSVQSMGGVAIRINTEAAHDPTRAALVGVDETELIVADTACLEEGWEVIESYVRILRSKRDKKKNLIFPLDKPILITWDTITAASPRTELAGSQYGEGMMIKPRLNRMYFRRLTVFLAAHNATLLLLSQISSGPKGTGAPGGYGIKHHTSARINITGGSFVYHGDFACGIVCDVRIRKNKLQPTQGWSVPIIIDYETGINNPWTNFNFLVNSEVYVDTIYGIEIGDKCPDCRGAKVTYKSDDRKRKHPTPCVRCRYQPMTKSGAWNYINEYPEPGRRINFYSKDFDNLLFKDGLKLGDYLDECTYKVFMEMLQQTSRTGSG